MYGWYRDGHFGAARWHRGFGATLPSITSPMTFQGNGATILGANAFPVFLVAPTGRLTLQQITVTRGPSTAGSGVTNQGNPSPIQQRTLGQYIHGADGGMINVAGGTLRVINTTVTCNTATGQGGGAFNANVALNPR
jgi:hypothetical protein